MKHGNRDDDGDDPNDQPEHASKRDYTPKPDKAVASLLSRKSRSARPMVKLPARFEPRFWESVDRRYTVTRAIKARYQALRESAGGGESVQRDMLIQRAVFLSVILETFECQAADGGDFDLGVYTQATNALSGIISKLGLEKRIKNVTDLKTYLEAKEA